MSTETASCIGKDRLDRVMAGEVARRMNGRNRMKVHRYQCRWCGYWHVGTEK